MSNQPSPERQTIAGTASATDRPLAAAKPLSPNDRAQAERIGSYLLNHLSALVLCLLAAHYVMTYEIGTIRPNEMNFVYMLIALAFGFDFYVCFHSRILSALFVGFATGLTAVLTMSVVVWFVSGSPIIGGFQERRDMIASITAMTLAYAAGNALASAVGHLLPAAFAGHDRDFFTTIKQIALSVRPVFERSAVDRIDMISSIFKALTGLMLAIGAAWVAMKGMFPTR